MAIEVIKPGLATSIQDSGRSGYYHVGIPPSGALDQYSFRAANLLVGNEEDAAVFEITMFGPELLFLEDALIAVTGATLNPKVNGVPYPCNTTVAIKKGQTLSFEFLKAGARAYLAVAGGVDVPLILGSRSSYGLGAFGGFKGRNIATGDVISIGAKRRAVNPERTLPPTLQSPLAKQVKLRVLKGLYDHRIEAESLTQFFDETWQVGSEADRIGYRLKGGSPLKFIERTPPFGAGSDPSNIVDSCYPIGSIQIPGGSEPIILHRDAVSGGGYMMVGTVISADLDIVAQLQPNFKVQFVTVDMQGALAARKAYSEKVSRLREVLLNL